MIWTTTVWTLPGNRALAYGPEIDYALVHVDSVDDISAACPGERLLIALALLPQVCAASGIATHHIGHVYKGAELAGLICAHPLRGHGYDHDAPMLPAEYVTTDQGTGFVHIAPAHGEEDFLLSRAYGIEVPEAVGPDGTYAAWVPTFAGVHVFKAAAPVGAAMEASGGLLARGTLLHSYPHSWRSKAPVIYRATPQWFIRMDGPEAIRAKALDEIARINFVPEAGARGSPAWSPAARTGASAASAPGACQFRCSSTAAPTSHCATRPWSPAPSPPSMRRARTPGTARRRAASSATTVIPTPMNRSWTSSMCGSRAAAPMPSRWRPVAARGRRTCISRAATSTAAGSKRACWRRSAPEAERRIRRF